MVPVPPLQCYDTIAQRLPLHIFNTFVHFEAINLVLIIGLFVKAVFFEINVSEDFTTTSLNFSSGTVWFWPLTTIAFRQNVCGKFY